MLPPQTLHQSARRRSLSLSALSVASMTSASHLRSCPASTRNHIRTLCLSHHAAAVTATSTTITSHPSSNSIESRRARHQAVAHRLHQRPASHWANNNNNDRGKAAEAANLASQPASGFAKQSNQTTDGFKASHHEQARKSQMAALRRSVAEDPYEAVFGKRAEPLWNALMPSWLRDEAAVATSTSSSEPREQERAQRRLQLLRDAAASVARDAAGLERGRSDRRSFSVASKPNASADSAVEDSPNGQLSTYSYAAAKSTSWDSWTNKARRAEWDSDSGETRVFEYDPISNRMVDVLALKKDKEGGSQDSTASATQPGSVEPAQKAQVDALANVQSGESVERLAKSMDATRRSSDEPAISTEFEQDLHLYNVRGRAADTSNPALRRKISPSPPNGRRRSPKPATLKDNFNPLDVLLDTLGAEVNAKNAASAIHSPKRTGWDEAVDDLALSRELEKLRLADDHATSTSTSSASVSATPTVAALHARRAAAEVRKASDQAALEAAKRAARDARFLQQDDYSSKASGVASVGAPASAEDEYAEGLAAQERIKCLEDAARRSAMELEKARLEVGSVLLREREMGQGLKTRLAARARSPGAGAGSGAASSAGSAAGGAAGNGGDGDGNDKGGIIGSLFKKLPTIGNSRTEAQQSQQGQSRSELLSQIARLQKQYTDQYGHQYPESQPPVQHIYTKPAAYRAPAPPSYRSSGAPNADLNRSLGSSLADFDNKSSRAPGGVSGGQRFDPAETAARIARDEDAATDEYYASPESRHEKIRQEEALDEFERRSKRYPSANDRFNPQDMVDQLVQEEHAAVHAFSAAHTTEERKRLDDELKRFSTAGAPGKHYSPEAAGGKFDPKDTAARIAREERAAHEEYASAYQSPVLPDDDRLARLVGKFPQRTSDSAAAQRAWEQENGVDPVTPESHSRSQLEGELTRFGGNAPRRFDPRQTAEEIHRETGAPGAPQQAHERLPDDERLAGLLGKFPQRTSDSAAAQKAWEEEQYSTPVTSDARAQRHLEEQLTRHTSRPTSAFGPDALSREIVQEQTTPSRNQDYRLPDDARLSKLVGQYPSGSSAESRFHAENARTPATSESRDRSYLTSELAKHNQSASAFDPATTASEIVRDDSKYYEQHQEQHSSFLPAHEESRFARPFTSEPASAFVTPDHHDASAHDSEHHPAAALNDYETSPVAARIAAQRVAPPPRYTILAYDASRGKVEVAETFSSFMGAEDEHLEQGPPDLARLENPQVFEAHLNHLTKEKGLNVVAVGRDWVALSTPASSTSSASASIQQPTKPRSTPTSAFSLKSFFGRGPVSSNHHSSNLPPSHNSPPPSSPFSPPRVPSTVSNDESHVFAPAAVPPASSRSASSSSSFSTTPRKGPSHTDLQMRMRTPAYDGFPPRSEQPSIIVNGENYHPRASEREDRNNPFRDRDRDRHRHRPRTSHHRRRHHRRRSRVTAVLLWSASVGVGAVALAYIVGAVAEGVS